MAVMSQFGTVLGVVVLIILVLGLAVLVQTLRLQSLHEGLVLCGVVGENLRACRADLTEKNRELQSALRAEQAHVKQLTRKVLLMQALLPEAYTDKQ